MADFTFTDFTDLAKTGFDIFQSSANTAAPYLGLATAITAAGAQKLFISKVCMRYKRLILCGLRKFAQIKTKNMLRFKPDENFYRLKDKP